MHLQQAGDEKHLEEFLKELNKKYEAAIKKIESKVKFKFSLCKSIIYEIFKLLFLNSVLKYGFP
jgi:hypothetical protein